MTKRYGGRGRPPRDEPKSRPIWCGQIDEDVRQWIVNTLTPEERFAALHLAALAKENQTPLERMAAMLAAGEERDG